MSKLWGTDEWLPGLNANELESVKKIIDTRCLKNNIKAWCKIGDLLEEEKTSDLCITDNYLYCDHIPLWPELYGTYQFKAEEDYFLHFTPDKIVSCFINRTDAFRQSWLYQLVRRNLFDHAHLSYHCFAHPGAFDNRVAPETPEEVFEYYFQSNKIFKKEHEYLKPLVPIKTFSGTVAQAIIDSKINLILETYHNSNYGIALSEKTFRNLQIPRPFVIFGNPGTVKHLRRCGFDVFDDIVDHSYDLNPNEIERQVMILDIVEQFKSVIYDQKLIDRLQQGYYNNKNLIGQLKEKWPTKLKNVLHQIDNINQENHELR